MNKCLPFEKVSSYLICQDGCSVAERVMFCLFCHRCPPIVTLHLLFIQSPQRMQRGLQSHPLSCGLSKATTGLALRRRREVGDRGCAGSVVVVATLQCSLHRYTALMISCLVMRRSSTVYSRAWSNVLRPHSVLVIMVGSKWNSAETCRWNLLWTQQGSGVLITPTGIMHAGCCHAWIGLNAAAQLTYLIQLSMYKLLYILIYW